MGKAATYGGEGLEMGDDGKKRDGKDRDRNRARMRNTHGADTSRQEGGRTGPECNRLSNLQCPT